MPKTSQKIAYKFLEWFGAPLIRAICLTLRVQRYMPEETRLLLESDQALIFCLWHGRMIVPTYFQRNQGIVVMISQHADGEMIARIVKRLGYATVRGSSTRGGQKAFYELLAALRAGQRGAMLPDGPTGPRHVFKPGTMFLAQQARVPIVPITFAAHPCWRFRSWDQFVFPKPFARAALCYGTPIVVPAELPEEQIEPWRQKLERSMIALVEQADAYFKRDAS